MAFSLTGITWKVSTDTVVMSALVVGDAFNFFSANGPSYMTTAAFAADKPEQTRDIRIGYRIGAAEALLIGGAITIYTKSWLPLAATLAAIAAMVMVYEHALAKGHSAGVGIAQQ